VNELSYQNLHKAAIAALEQADMALAHAPKLAIEEPHRAEHINADTLTQMLGKGVINAKVDHTNLVDAHDGMTTRNKITLQWNKAGQDAGLPNQVFVKVTPDGPYLRETLSMLHMSENEVQFYNQVQPELPELAPKAYYSKSYPGGRFLILMEVLEARKLKPYWQVDVCSFEHAKAVIAALAKLHASYWESARFNTDLVWVRPRTQRFGFEWLQNSFKLARSQFLESEVGASLPSEIIELIRLWDTGLNDRKVYAYWDSLPATLLHGDTHLGNTFSYPDGRAGFFDWQCIYRGYGLREVAYFFLTALPNDVREKHEREIVDYYLDELEARGVSIDRRAAWLNYCSFVIDMLDCNIKTIMRGGYGHASSALQRTTQALIGSITENDVLELLKRILRDGKI
jgi:hypothetical protein